MKTLESKFCWGKKRRKKYYNFNGKHFEIYQIE